jgi:hypothetical protein
MYKKTVPVVYIWQQLGYIIQGTAPPEQTVDFPIRMFHEIVGKMGTYHTGYKGFLHLVYFPKV